MKKIIIVGLCMFVASPAFCRIRTHFSNQEVLTHVVNSKAMSEALKKPAFQALGELSTVTFSRVGEFLESRYSVNFKYSTPGVGEDFKAKNRPCYVVAQTSIEVVSIPEDPDGFRITIGQLKEPTISDPVCAE